MYIKTKVIAILLALSLLSPVMVSAKGRVSNQQQQSSLSEAEKATLLWMREEEKLARDVYLTLYKEWNASIFNNIAKSEQSHMDALLKKIEFYGLDDSATTVVGDFNNEELQDLYDDLVETGMQSYEDALWVGVTIEDLDILDIAEAIHETDELALQTTYESLLEGSKSHLRAFVDLFDADKSTEELYVPQYIDQDLYDAIIDL